MVKWFFFRLCMSFQFSPLPQFPWQMCWMAFSCILLSVVAGLTCEGNNHGNNLQWHFIVLILYLHASCGVWDGNDSYFYDNHHNEGHTSVPILHANQPVLNLCPYSINQRPEPLNGNNAKLPIDNYVYVRHKSVMGTNFWIEKLRIVKTLLCS